MIRTTSVPAIHGVAELKCSGRVSCHPRHVVLMLSLEPGDR